MKKIVILVLVSLLSFQSYSQKLNGIWFLGHQRQWSHIDNRYINLDLSGNESVIVFDGTNYYRGYIDIYGDFKPEYKCSYKLCNDYFIDNFRKYRIVYTSPGTFELLDKDFGKKYYWIKVDKLPRKLKKGIRNEIRRFKERDRRGH